MYSAGNVVQIRLNPEDVMSCIDVVHASGVDTTGMSIAMVVRLALSAFLEGARQNDTIPRREGFEFTQMVAPFVHTNKAKKLQVTSTILNTEISRIKVDLPASQFTINSAAAEPEPMQLSPEFIRKKGRIITRILELQGKQEADPDNFTAAEVARLNALEEALNSIQSGQDVDITKLL